MTAVEYADEYDRHLPLCQVAGCERPHVGLGFGALRLCAEHDAQWEAARVPNERGTYYAQAMDWLHSVGGGWWDPRPAVLPE